MKIKPFPLIQSIETKKILKKTIQANRALARLNGVAQIIPNQNILINSLVLQEAKDFAMVEMSRHIETIYRKNQIISVYKKVML